ncbi:NlpC/P60 family protein [Paenibacillus hodogayensis]|uniref:NlpC/P60 family protein n=1 Tax=Paenibacillus hodogayensis TaxID=279208 RepID=A0ABV5W4G7_9BACL
MVYKKWMLIGLALLAVLPACGDSARESALPSAAEWTIREVSPSGTGVFGYTDAVGLAAHDYSVDEPDVIANSATESEMKEGDALFVETGMGTSIGRQAEETDSGGCGKLETQGKEWLVNAPVATLWTGPGLGRAKDKPGQAALADTRKWTDKLNAEDRLWLVGKLETQALFGQPVSLVEERGEWTKVIVLGQSTSRHTEGYPGWMPRVQLAESAIRLDHAACPVLVIRAATAFLFDDAEGTVPFLELSFNTRLPLLREDGESYVVQTPTDGPKYMMKADAFTTAEREQSAPPSGERIVETAKQFLGLPYLWSGISGFGFDCSGFTHSLHSFYGIDIPRDASDQAKQGAPVDRGALRPGDLLFFADANGKGKVHHVGMYAGDGQMIHSPNSRRSVETIALDTPAYAKEFAGARRFIPE